MAKILVTGATGFIGGAICIELKKLGHTIVGVDQVRREHMLDYIDEFHNADIFNKLNLVEDVDMVIHCASSIMVGDSVEKPADYYFNNTVKTILLLNSIISKNNVPFFFSSTASVYKTSNEPLAENSPIMPVSPYSFSKYSIERICEDYRVAYGLKYCIFRYFNACGAIGEQHGQPPGAEHIFPKLFEGETFRLNGDDFDTKDGTCIRDYIHVSDIVSAHINAMYEGAEGIYNLGSGVGFSNKEIMDHVFNVIGEKPVEIGPRRAGDVDKLIADPSIAKVLLKWAPVNSLDDIVSDLVQWYNSDNFKRLKHDSNHTVH
jgi:UDP-glucose 4-epimerase